MIIIVNMWYSKAVTGGCHSVPLCSKVNATSSAIISSSSAIRHQGETPVMTQPIFLVGPAAVGKPPLAWSWRVPVNVILLIPTTAAGSGRTNHRGYRRKEGWESFRSRGTAALEAVTARCGNCHRRWELFWRNITAALCAKKGFMIYLCAPVAALVGAPGSVSEEATSLR